MEQIGMAGKRKWILMAALGLVLAITGMAVRAW